MKLTAGPFLRRSRLTIKTVMPEGSDQGSASIHAAQDRHECRERIHSPKAVEKVNDKRVLFDLACSGSDKKIVKKP